MIYAVASLNTLIVMVVCAHTGIELRFWAWMSLFVLLAMVRTTMWLRRSPTALPPARVSSALRRSAAIGFGCLLVIGGFASVTFVAETFARSTIIPITLAFGSMSIAHCFSTYRPAAIAALLVGLVPTALAMLLVGHFEAQVLGLSMLTVAALMVRFVASQYDQLVTELELQTEVHHLANTDALTGLHNRRALMAQLEQRLSAGQGFALALLDLDDFKLVNDRLGHLAGDALLKVVATRLTASTGSTGVVGRLGGDEFVVVLDGGDVDARVDALLKNLCQPTTLEGESVPVSSSLGYALFPRDGQSTTALLAAADAALYATKRERPSSRGVEAGDRRKHRAR
jgi:diguanylate cyclase (GGDEF)-like protein